MVLIASLLFFLPAYKCCQTAATTTLPVKGVTNTLPVKGVTNTLPSGEVPTTLPANVGRQETYKELMEKSRRMESGSFNYSVSFSLLGFVNISFPVYYTKFGDDSKLVTSMSLFGAGSTTAAYWMKNKSISCSEYGDEIDCSAGAGESTYASDFFSLPDLSKMEKLEASFLHKEEVIGRKCSLFEVNMTSLLNQTNQTTQSYIGLFSQQSSNITYLICVDDEYGFPSSIIFITKTYSRLADVTTEIPVLTATLTGFSNRAKHEETLPLKDIDFIANEITCEGKNITANVSFLWETKPALTINATRYEDGTYNKTTGEYSPGEYKTLEHAQFKIPSYTADSYLLEYTSTKSLSGATVTICSQTHCQTQYCSYTD
jgi:hypothetical protein